ncbi:MAG TPA: hypothetical protein VGL68_05020 [Solirubrobacteraceae bacterium]|jgi:hypothetical protein
MRPRLPPPRALLLGLVGVLSAVALAACGSSSAGSGLASSPPAEIIARAKAAADSANSVYISGRLVSKGVPVSLKMELLVGKGGRGRVAQNGLSFELVQVGGVVYIDGSAAFYRHIGGSAAAQILHGRWLKAPARAPAFAPIAALTNLGDLIGSALASSGPLTNRGVTTLHGQKAVAIDDVSQGGTVYIAATGKPYPLEVVKDGGKGGAVVFDRWNEPVTLVAPADAIDVTKLHASR